MSSVDLSQTHLKTTHVIAIFVAIVTAGIAIAKTYMDVSFEVRKLSDQQKEIPTKKDLTDLQATMSTDMNHAASERVKFYMEHAKLECEPATRTHKQTCHLVWPVPESER